jgi:hypothetical protein
VTAELAGQRPLLERAATGDREAFAQLYDTQVDGIYRYLLAWTGDRAEAAELTAGVFTGAFSWLTVTNAEGEVAAWLTAMARDAVAQRRGSGATSTAAGPVAAVARLSDPKREVAVLRLLCGHSLDHTAHLSGFARRAVLELQLSACLSVWELTSGWATPARRNRPPRSSSTTWSTVLPTRPAATRSWPVPWPSPSPCARPPTARWPDPTPPWSTTSARAC